MTKEELTGFINVCYQAVEESRIGKIERIVQTKEGENQLFVTVLGQQTFLTLLSKMIPSHAIATMDAKMAMKEPKESWQGEE